MNQHNKDRLHEVVEQERMRQETYRQGDLWNMAVALYEDALGGGAWDRHGMIDAWHGEEMGKKDAATVARWALSMAKMDAKK